MTTPPRLRTQAHFLITVVLAFVICHSFVVISASAASGELTGRVTDPDGRAVVNAEVLIYGTIAAPLRTRTASDGTFAATALPTGRYYVIASAPGLVSDPVAVEVSEAGPASVEISLRVSAITETLVVSAAQIDQPLSRTPDSITVIRGAEIDARQQFTLGAALRSVPGLALQQSGGPGTLTSLFTRGGESDYTLVLVDGVRVNAFGGGLDLSQVPLQNVDRIEVVRGPQSALYGSDAIAGVINVVTRTGGGPSAQAQVEGGSRSMLRGAASTTGEARGVRWQFGAQHMQDDGYTGTAGDGETVANDDAEQSEVSGALGWRHATSGADLLGNLQYVDTDRGSPGPFGSDPMGRYEGVDRIARSLTSRIGGGARWVQPWFGPSSRVRQRVEFDRADYDLTFRSRFGESAGTTTRSHARVQTDVAASAAFGASGGIDWLGESGGSTFITAGSAGDEIPVDRSVLGFFAEGRWNAGDRASLSAGVRVDRIARSALAGDPLAFQPRPAFPEEVLTSVNPKFAGSVLLREATRVHGAFGTGIRPPDAFEIAFTDNSGLKPERSQSAEFGVSQLLARGIVHLDATAFFNDYSDLIIAVGRTFSGSSRYRTDNISNARARGAELSAAWRPAPAFDLRGSYTFLDSEIRAVNGSSSAPAPYAVGDPLLRRPRHSGTFDATWTALTATAFLQLQARGDTLDADPSFGPAGGLFVNPGHTVVNAGAAWKPVKQLELFARLLNLFDEQYEEVLGYPAPGRTAYVGARVAVGR